MFTASSLPTSVGFIGLGAMGRPMAVNLARNLSSGSKIHVHDVVESVVEELQTLFPRTIVNCASAKEVTERSDVILTMLPEASHVSSVYLDPDNGIIAALPATTTASVSLTSARPKVLIDSSSIDTATSLDIKEQLLVISPETSFYDAPVSGGTFGAANGTIAFYLGCHSSDPHLPNLTALLQTMGNKVIPCGGPSLGLAAKLSNNYLSGIIAIACSEAMDMGMRTGIDPEVLAAVFAAGTAQNAICDRFNPVPGVCPQAPSSNGYRGGFRIQHMKKDMGLAVQMARNAGARNVLGSTALGTYVAASDTSECRDLDSRVVYRYLGGREDWKKKDL